MVNAAFGFDPMTVFGDVRKEARNSKKKRKDKDCLECMQEDSMTDGFGLGIDTFSLADPNIDALGIGEGFGSNIIAPAGQANGRGSLARGGFLGIVGEQQLSVPAVVGRVRPVGSAVGKGRKARKKLSPLQKKADGKTPLQRASGTKFGTVEDKFTSNTIGNIRGIKRRIDDVRIRRKTRKQLSEEPERSPRQLEGGQPALIERREPAQPIEQRTPALPSPTREATPRESGSSAIARLREEASSRSAT